jgi:hypothetical protein
MAGSFVWPKRSILEHNHEREPGILNGGGEKPKWMRWRTFERLAAKHDAFVGESLARMALRFGIKF